MHIQLSGFKTWKHIKDTLGMLDFYFLPTIIFSKDDVYDADDYPTEITIAWLFFTLRIYFRG